MIKAIMLIFEPGVAWNRIVAARKSFGHVLVTFFLPIVLISIGGELAGIFYLGRHEERGGIVTTIKLPTNRIIVCGASELVLSFIVAFTGALLIKSVSETFHSRPTFGRCFTLVAYTLSPLFLVHLADVYPGMNPWISFAIGMTLSVATLYHGVPKILQPEPVHAFGVYLVSAVLLVGVAGLARFLTWLILTGKLKIF